MSSRKAQQFTRRGYTGTPTVLVKGQVLADPTVPNLTAAIDADR